MERHEKRTGSEGGDRLLQNYIANTDSFHKSDFIGRGIYWNPGYEAIEKTEETYEGKFDYERDL